MILATLCNHWLQMPIELNNLYDQTDKEQYEYWNYLTRFAEQLYYHNKYVLELGFSKEKSDTGFWIS